MSYAALGAAHAKHAFRESSSGWVNEALHHVDFDHSKMDEALASITAHSVQGMGEHGTLAPHLKKSADDVYATDAVAAKRRLQAVVNGFWGAFAQGQHQRLAARARRVRCRCVQAAGGGVMAAMMVVAHGGGPWLACAAAPPALGSRALLPPHAARRPAAWRAAHHAPPPPPCCPCPAPHSPSHTMDCDGTHCRMCRGAMVFELHELDQGREPWSVRHKGQVLSSAQPKQVGRPGAHAHGAQRGCALQLRGTAAAVRTLNTAALLPTAARCAPASALTRCAGPTTRPWSSSRAWAATTRTCCTPSCRTTAARVSAARSARGCRCLGTAAYACAQQLHIEPQPRTLRAARATPRAAVSLQPTRPDASPCARAGFVVVLHVPAQLLEPSHTNVPPDGVLLWRLLAYAGPPTLPRLPPPLQPQPPADASGPPSAAEARSDAASAAGGGEEQQQEAGAAGSGRASSAGTAGAGPGAPEAGGHALQAQEQQGSSAAAAQAEGGAARARGPHVCALCGLFEEACSGVHLFSCPCGEAAYCGPAHQAQHWKAHKLVCSKKQ